ncbi:MAG: MFS transporter [Patescibacteria group bacterium]
MREKPSLWLIFFISFLDLLGISIIIPILAPMFLGDNSFLPADASFGTRTVILGFLLAIYPLAQFFSAPLLGAWSDKIGRKPVLALAFTGTMCAHIMVALGIVLGNLPLLFFARLLDGFTGGNISVVHAITADISKQKQRAKNFGLVGMAFGASYVIGPFFGGKLSDPGVVEWFTYATPFWVASALSALTVVLTLTQLRETLLEKKKQSDFSLLSGLKSIYRVMSSAKTKLIMWILFLHAVGFTFFTLFYQVILVESFDFTPNDIGQFFAYIGVWIVITQGLVNPWVSKRLLPRNILPYSIIALVVLYILLLFIEEAWLIYVLGPFIALAQGMTIPSLLATVSNSVSGAEQGEVLGVQQSLTSIAVALPPVIAGFLAIIHISLPLIAAAMITAIGWTLYTFIYRTKTHF